jgi:hypothetical protein
VPWRRYVGSQTPSCAPTTNLTAPAQDAAFFGRAIRNCGEAGFILAAETQALQAASSEYERKNIYTRLGRLPSAWRRLDYREGLSAAHNRLALVHAEAVEAHREAAALEAAA